MQLGGAADEDQTLIKIVLEKSLDRLGAA